MLQLSNRYGNRIHRLSFKVQKIVLCEITIGKKYLQASPFLVFLGIKLLFTSFYMHFNVNNFEQVCGLTYNLHYNQTNIKLFLSVMNVQSSYELQIILNYSYLSDVHTRSMSVNSINELHNTCSIPLKCLLIYGTDNI